MGGRGETATVGLPGPGRQSPTACAGRSIAIHWALGFQFVRRFSAR